MLHMVFQLSSVHEVRRVLAEYASEIERPAALFTFTVVPCGDGLDVWESGELAIGRDGPHGIDRVLRSIETKAGNYASQVLVNATLGEVEGLLRHYAPTGRQPRGSS